MPEVSIEFIMWITAERAKINKMDLDDITFTEWGEPIEIPQAIIREFEMTGLSNVDFITSRFYLKEPFLKMFQEAKDVS